ncbi:MAG: DUF2779 domain-containing protein [Acidimicrobiaceae bacterium]|nr:DUF2779 domain-containing protein [Acidimicrobiaceae bacterium]
MTDRAKLLSKSNFLLGGDCQVKLKYFKSGYPSVDESNSYLEFFADGGFMVEALARALFPSGLWIQPNAGETPESATARMLESPGDGVWFEPTFVVDGLLIRADILQRIGTTWRLIEVKAASFNSLEEPNPFRGKRGGILSGWRDYLLDIAFQTHVLEMAYPKMRVEPELCLVDKSKTCLEEAIFNKVELHSDNDPGSSGPRATYTGDHQAFAKQHFLGFLNVRTEVDELAAEVSAQSKRLLEIVADPTIAITPPIGNHCRDCEYRNIHRQPDGFAQCWGELATGMPHIVDLFRADLLADEHGIKGNGIASLIGSGVSKLVDIPTKMIDTTKSTGRRQITQLECTISGNEYLDPLLRAELEACEYPLHFVDFETSRLAVPYHKGMQPYEQIAFQFSCHTIAHKGATELQHREWINVEDAYPSFDFVRALRDAIGDTGTMIVWSDFEQSTLKDIRVQMDRYKLGDAKLAAWIDALVPDRKNAGRVQDLLELCSLHYYHPKMGRSVSIKYVLPAIWGSNSYLWCDPWFAKYFRESLDGALDPYEALSGESSDSEKETTVDAVRDGIGAMRTYQEMMYGLSRGDAKHRAVVKKMLLQYCQLDTAAMVIIWKHWVTMLGAG